MINIKAINKSYGDKDKKIKVLQDISLQINKGELLLLLGASGSGKSTLLNLIGGIDRVDSGSIQVDGVEITSLNPNQLADYRAKKVAFIFQTYNLITSLSVEDNIRIVDEMSGGKARVDELLKNLGIEDLAKKYPSQLSGGQQQRVSIARSLAKDTPILLCDEPTGALDTKTGNNIMDLLKGLTNKGKTVIISTHNVNYEKYADRIVSIKDGKIQLNQDRLVE